MDTYLKLILIIIFSTSILKSAVGEEKDTAFIDTEYFVDNEIVNIDTFFSIREPLEKPEHVNYEIRNKNDDRQSNCNLYSVLGALLGAFISAMVSLVIYRLGERKEKKNRINEINDFGDDISILTEEVLRAGKTQLEFLKKYITDLEQAPYKSNSLLKTPLHQLDRIRSFQIDKVKKAFRLFGLTNKDFVNFYNQIDYLYELFNALDDDYEETNSKIITPLTNDFLKLKHELMIDLSEYTASILKNEKRIKSNVGQYFENLMNDYSEPIREHSIPNIKYDYDNFIDKLLVSIDKHNIDESFSNITNRKLHRARELYITIESQSKDFAENLKQQIEPVENSLGVLEDILNKLKRITPANMV